MEFQVFHYLTAAKHLSTKISFHYAALLLLKKDRTTAYHLHNDGENKRYITMLVLQIQLYIAENHKRRTIIILSVAYA